MPRRVTLADIARRAKLGKSTVSRALANHPACAESTRQRIQKLAREMGYAPDPALSALVAHRVNYRSTKAPFNLAIITEDFPVDGYLGRLWNAVDNEAERHGYEPLRIREDTTESPAALGRMLVARGVRGIVWGWLRRERFLTEFPWDRFAHVGFLLPLIRPSITRVHDDSFQSVYDAAEAAFARGCKRPGLALMTSPGSANDRSQMGGWLVAHQEHGRSPVPVWRSFARDRESLADWVRANRLDLVIGNTDGVFWQLRAQGLRVPEEPGFLNLLHPGATFAGFDCREEQIGQVLIDVLDRKIRHNDLGLQDNPQKILVRRRFLGWDARA